MAQSTLVANEDRKRKPSEPIRVDDAALAELESSEKNVNQSAFSVHPKLMGAMRRHLRENAANLLPVDPQQPNVLVLNRTKIAQYLRRLIAADVNYTGDLVLPRAGGNVIGVVSSFNTLVAQTFATIREMGDQFGMPLEQQKQVGFDRIKAIMAADPTYSKVEIAPELLESMWDGATIEIEVEEDDDDDDDDE